MPDDGTPAASVSAGGAASRYPPACLDLDDRPDAAPAGRRFVEAQVLARGGAALVDDVVLVSAELLANARQHGLPPISVTVSGDAADLRVEVHDASPRRPVRAVQSSSNMTGRGITLIEALGTRWGVDRLGDGGKSVWVEFRASATKPVPRTPELEDLLATFGEETGTDAERFTVVLGDVPTDFLIEAKAHIDNLVREFTLASDAGRTGTAEVPEHLARLIETVVHGFRDARDAIKRQALAAAKRGDVTTRLTLHLPVSAATAGEAYLSALDDADEYARAARLLTLETPPDHRLFRRWYVEALVTQLRDLAVGRRATPVIPFQEVLVAEVRRLSLAQRVSERAARLQQVTAALANARTPEDVAAVVVSEGVEVLGASGGGMLLPAGDGEHVAVPGAVGYDAELVGALREERLDAPLPAATVIRTGRPVWLESRQERDRDFPALRGFERATVSMCAVPLVVGSRLLGALRFSFNTRRLFDDDERAFVLALAAQTAQTLQRTELYEIERQTALQLQRALLPEELPMVPGWEIAHYYSPAGQQEAGGDFYDVIRVGSGLLAAIVGDVMGRGVAAAAAMAQVRSTIRAYAVDDPDPVTVFRRVDSLFEALDLPQLVTASYFLIDPRTGEVQVSSAGHLPAILVDATGSRIVAAPSNLPFGVEHAERQMASVTLDHGAALIAITDGLVERRGHDIDEGIRRILDSLRRTAGWTAHSLLNHVVTNAVDGHGHDDDVTVLVARRL